MIVYLSRLFRNEHETIGILSTAGRVLCHTLEDEKRTKKVYGETRIPAGKYRITLRTEGLHHLRYKKKFPFHKGMLWIRDVPNFKWILIHIGNDEDDTAGCILTGKKSVIKVNNRFILEYSTDAYKRIYPIIANPISNGEGVYIHIRDELNDDIYDWRP